MMKEMSQPVVNVLAIKESLKSAVRLDATVFRDSQEDDSVYGLLDGEIEFRLCQCRVA